MSHLIDSILCGASLLLAFIILVNPNRVNLQANKWFSAFLFCLFLVALQSIVLQPGLLAENDTLFEVINVSNFMIAPVFYLSVSYYIEPVKKWRNIYGLHFSLAFFILFLILLAACFSPPATQNEVSPHTLENVKNVVNAIFSLQVILYCAAACRKLVKHHRNIQNLNSTIANVDLGWLKNLSVAVIVIAVFWLADIIFNLSDHSLVFDFLSSMIYLSAVFYISYFWLKQQEVFPYSDADKTSVDTIINKTTNPNNRFPKTNEKLEELKVGLLELFATQKPFLMSDLTLVGLAKNLNISPHLLSFVINKGFNENFYQFVNRYRIEEAKKLLADKNMDHLSLLGIGFEVGFNSKTVFNTTFKKMTGQTPSQFKKQLS